MDKTFFKRMTTSEEYELWFQLREARITSLTELLEGKIKLNYSLESITQLCQWLLDTYETSEVAYNRDGIYVLDCVATYVGETFIQLFGGIWKLQDDIQDYAYGFPGIADYRTKRENAIVDHPHIWVTATIGRRSCFILEHMLRIGAFEES